MTSLVKVATWALAGIASVDALSDGLTSGRQTVRDLRKASEVRASTKLKRDIDPALLYPEHNFTTPIDHFHNETKYEPHSDGTFNMRYWFDASHYEPGGPIIILQSGETSAAGRLPFLQKGILAQLAEATHGIGVVLEHRYYGTSFPTPDLSTENLRFLTTAQALKDEAYFAQNIQFPGLEDLGDLTSKTTAYLSYGGSYSGAFSAFLRVQYPETFFGAISSSGVTKAIYDYWQYYEPIAENGPPECIAAQKTLTHIVDNILIGKNDSDLTATLKSSFGLPNVTYDNDFANTLASGIGNWQSLNWDPAVGSLEVYNYCANISDTDVLYPATESLRSTASYLISQGGYSANTSLVNQMLNYIGYVNLTSVSSCAEEEETQDQCFSNHNATFYQQDSLDDTWRAWPYQYCTEWGYLQTGSGVPQDQLPLISRTLDLDYMMIICNEAFGIYGPPNTTTVNKYGGYDISYPRLAFIDGEWDPWRPATPHAFGKERLPTTSASSALQNLDMQQQQQQPIIDYGAPDRPSAPSEPFILIPDAVHHWDENGVFPNQTNDTFPPPAVADTQQAEVEFVRGWMEEWKKGEMRGGGKGDGCWDGEGHGKGHGHGGAEGSGRGGWGWWGEGKGWGKGKGKGGEEGCGE
ncbi:serine carboxypeptidase [Hortaea werneckii]|nr:serine carboxypeptidase [Hortaea werneckii]